MEAPNNHTRTTCWRGYIVVVSDMTQPVRDFKGVESKPTLRREHVAQLRNNIVELRMELMVQYESRWDMSTKCSSGCSLNMYTLLRCGMLSFPYTWDCILKLDTYAQTYANNLADGAQSLAWRVCALYPNFFGISGAREVGSSFSSRESCSASSRNCSAAPLSAFVADVHSESSLTR